MICVFLSLTQCGLRLTPSFGIAEWAKKNKVKKLNHWMHQWTKSKIEFIEPFCSATLPPLELYMQGNHWMHQWTKKIFFFNCRFLSIFYETFYVDFTRVLHTTNVLFLWKKKVRKNVLFLYAIPSGKCNQKFCFKIENISYTNGHQIDQKSINFGCFWKKIDDKQKHDNDWAQKKTKSKNESLNASMNKK